MFKSALAFSSSHIQVQPSHQNRFLALVPCANFLALQVPSALRPQVWAERGNPMSKRKVQQRSDVKFYSMSDKNPGWD
jgi:hypothetical protein